MVVPSPNIYRDYVQQKNSFEAPLSTNHGRPVNDLCEFKSRKRVKDRVNRNSC
jgi:hypothetical protein